MFSFLAFGSKIELFILNLYFDYCIFGELFRI